MKLQRRRPARHPLCLVFTALAAAAADAQDDDMIYCLQYHRDIGVGEVYYSGVFAGDYGSTLGYENDFYDYLESRGFEPDITESFCHYADTRTEAENRMLRDIAEDRGYNFIVVQTQWEPAGSAGAASDAEPFTPQPLRDFRISVLSSPFDVQVCVRDHECEDGDRVRVSVNGIELMSEEIVNGWMCRNVALREGRHDIELFAINGTGYKGDNCSHADANTGEIRVTGEDSQTQSWRHRGGAGSSASIEVTVR